jgi:hypothetical protein
VAELADALDSKSGTRESVWVRPPPSAPSEMPKETIILALFIHFSTANFRTKSCRSGELYEVFAP